MRVEIFNPQLSDFSQDQQLIALRSFLEKKVDLENHIKGLKLTHSFANMMAKEIRYYQSQVDDLDVLITQFAGAIHIKQKETQIASN